METGLFTGIGLEPGYQKSFERKRGMDD